MEVVADVTHVNGWFSAVYMSYTSQNFRLFNVSNLSVLNFILAVNVARVTDFSLNSGE